MTTQACPCNSGKPFAQCCQPYLEGKAVPPTAEATMRSRYTAYVTKNIDYLEKTLSVESRKDFDRKSAAEWADRAAWENLVINETAQGQPGDSEGEVDFTAHYKMDGKPIVHRERSRFIFEDGGWRFHEELKPVNKPVVRAAVPGRNDPCSCGSGKKYKKCHGAS